MRGRLRKQLGEYVRRRRGDLSYAKFARKIGISSSTLQRIELGEQNVTLDMLEELLKRLRCEITDLFSDSK